MSYTQTIAPCIQRLSPELVITPDTQVGSAFTSLENTHDALIVKDDEGNFLGIISPSQSFFSSRYPYHTKAQKCLLKPARITKESQFWEVAREMIAKRTYTLPVFEADGTVDHIITAKKMLSCMQGNFELLELITSQIAIQPVHKVSIDGTVKDVYETMRDKDVSRVVLVDEEEKLVGITTRADIRHAFSKPALHERYRAKDGNKADYTFDDEKVQRLDAPIRNFYTKNVFTTPSTLDMMSMLVRLLHATRSSVVVVDPNNRPVGVISTKTILGAIALLEPLETIPVKVAKPKRDIKQDMEKIMDVVDIYLHKLHHKYPVMNADLTFKEVNSAARNILDVQAKLQVKLKNGLAFIAQGNDRSYVTAIYQATHDLDRQVGKIRS